MVTKSTGKKGMTFTKEYLMYQEKELMINKKFKKLIIGIPNETERGENRICLTPESIQVLVAMGNEFIIQRGAGEKANYSDNEYSDAGAIMVDSIEEVYTADIIIKTSSVSIQDAQYMRNRQTVLSSLKLYDIKKEAITEMMQKKVTAIGFDIMKDEEGFYPIVRIMSEIAGNVAIMIAAEYLSQAREGKGIILGGVTGITPTEVMILGAGTLGEYAARAAIGLGASVKVFDPSANKLRKLKENLGQQNLFTSVLHEPVIEKALLTTDVVIGALRCFDNTNNIVIREEQVSKMKKGSIIVDLAVDHGGCIETVGPTTHEKPIYTYKGVLHYCVPNVLSRVPRTASIAYSNVLLPLLKEMAWKDGFDKAFKTDMGLRNGVYIYNGILTKDVIADKFGLICRDIDLLMAAL